MNWCRLAARALPRDGRLLWRGLKLLFSMAYIKAYDVTIVTAFRATVAKFPNRVMYVNASIGTEWTYSKVMGVKLPLIYHFSLHLRDSGGGCCCWSKESIRGQGGMVFLFNSIRLQRIIGGFRDTGCLLCKPLFGRAG